MKFRSALQWLVPLIAILALIASVTGLFLRGGSGPHPFTSLRGQTTEIYGQGLYQNDTTLIGAGSRGTDAVTLFVALPLLAAAFWLYRRGSLKGYFMLSGAVCYFLYIAASYTFGLAFNRLFLVYAALFSASLFALIITFTSLDVERLPGLISPRLPNRGMAVLLIVAGLGTLFIWMSDLIGPLLNGSAPANLGPYTTMYTHGFDSATITPWAVLTGISLWRKKPLGYLFAAPVLILCTLVGVTVISQTVFQTLAGLVFSPGVYVGMIGSWVLMGAFSIGMVSAFFRNLNNANGITDGWEGRAPTGAGWR